MNTQVKLQKIVRHAYHTVPFYHRLFEESHLTPEDITCVKDLSKLPILVKEQLQSEVHDHLSSSYSVQYMNGLLIEKRTSGSTGKCLKIFWSISDSTLSDAGAWKYRGKWYGVTPQDRYLSFHTTLYAGNRLIQNQEILQKEHGVNLSINKMNLHRANLKEYYRRIKEFNPGLILGQPSILEILAGFLLENHLTLDGVRYIEMTGEYLTRAVRDHIGRAFPQAKIANMYGSNETGTIALECPNGHMHLVESNTVVEIDKQNPEDEDGNVLVTSLRNTAMPILHYALGDRAKIFSVECEYASSPAIEVTAGRVGQTIHLPNGEVKGCYVLLHPVEYINNDLNNPITQFQVVQKTPDTFDVYLALAPQFKNWKKAISEIYEREAAVAVGAGLTWNFHFEEKLFPDEHTGKLQFFKSELN